MLSPQPHPPFWKDDLEFQQFPIPDRFIRFFRLWIAVGHILIPISIFAILFAAFYKKSPVFSWGILIYSILLLVTGTISGIRGIRRRKLILQEISQIQQRAREKTGASLIGSAVHVAGHPRLEREQKVVLALTPTGIQVFSYESDQLVDTISFEQIAAVHTVVYDDERTPHLDTVDSTAQALQLTLKYGNGEFDCLLRRMRKARPIDWYHAIQKNRIQVNAI
jgi:hypothetical protein